MGTAALEAMMDGRFHSLTVDRIVTLVRRGESEEQILARYPELVAEDVRAALRYYDSTRRRLRWASIAKVFGVFVVTATVVAVGLVIESEPLVVFGAVLAAIAVAGSILGVMAELREQKRLMRQEPVRPSRIGLDRRRRRSESFDSEK